MVPVREIASVEIHCIIEELKAKVADGFVRKFYDLGGGAFRFTFYKGTKNTMVYCKLLSTFNETSLSESAGEPSQFAMGMRKRIEGCKVSSLSQHGSDRIIELGILSKEGEYKLVMEMFGKGDIALVNAKGMIEQCYTNLSFKDRDIKPRSEYRFPQSQALDIWNASEKQVLDAVKAIKGMNKAMSEMSKAINFGPLYLENIFNAAGINPKGKIASDEEAENLAGGISEFLRQLEKPEPRIYKSDGKAVDYAIIPIKKYEDAGFDSVRFDTVSAMLDEMHSGERATVKDDANAKRTAELSSNIKRQEELTIQLKAEAADYQISGNMIMARMHEINSLIEYLRQNKRATIQELESSFKGLKIKGLDLKNKTVKVELGE